MIDYDNQDGEASLDELRSNFSALRNMAFGISEGGTEVGETNTFEDLSAVFASQGIVRGTDYVVRNLRGLKFVDLRDWGNLLAGSYASMGSSFQDVKNSVDYRIFDYERKAVDFRDMSDSELSEFRVWLQESKEDFLDTLDFIEDRMKYLCDRYDGSVKEGLDIASDFLRMRKTLFRDTWRAFSMSFEKL